ncbi:MAG TPA: DUF916 domain-containing protein [Candidatus Paceibacterota bacterium]|nr:DUF916 domain-containing protein [Candidatus Paceibacterota bacterium]
MQTNVHRIHVLATVFGALFVLACAPSLAYAEDASTTVGSGDSLLNLYPTEGIPGGDAVIGDFVVGPGKVDLTVKPGETKVVKMTVTNRTGERRRFNLHVEDAAGSEDVNTPIVLLGSDRGPYSLKDYVHIPYLTFDLDQNERATIPVTISLPPDAEPGGLYGSVLVDTVSVEANPGIIDNTVPQSAIIARVGTLFFITVPGAVERNGTMKSFTTVPEETFYASGPIHFGVLFENTGSMHLAPYGEIRVTNMFGDEVGFVELDPWFVLPQSLRLREVTWDRGYLFGRYTATAKINRSYDDTIDEMSYTFWVLPWKPLTAAFIALFIVFFLIRLFFRTFEFKRKG